jgi:small nuclear ribonucleoprotein (snRNP)-like protein
MDKRLMLQLNCNRKITGVLRGFDPFMNIVLDEAVEERSAEQRIPMGLAVCCGGEGLDGVAVMLTRLVCRLPLCLIDGPGKQHCDGRGLGAHLLTLNHHGINMCVNIACFHSPTL